MSINATGDIISPAAVVSSSSASSAAPTIGVPVLTAVNALNFFRTIGKLKTLKRTGWVNHEIQLPESVADHMYRMSMLSFAICDKDVNKDLLIKICLIHDLAEALAGDITPYDGISKEKKRKLEESALDKIVQELDHVMIAEEIRSLWLEYEQGSSLEAAIARQLDKFEMILQANEYEIAQPEKVLDSFFESTLNSFVHPEVVAWSEQLRDERDKRLKRS